MLKTNVIKFQPKFKLIIKISFIRKRNTAEREEGKRKKMPKGAMYMRRSYSRFASRKFISSMEETIIYS